MYIAGDLDQLARFRREERPLEELHLRRRTELAQTRAALAREPDNRELAAQVKKLEADLAELERRAPWIAGDVPVELALWGAGGGPL